MVTWRLAVPKGRIYDGVAALLADSGLPLKASSRSYRPVIDGTAIEVKILKPQNIPQLVALGVYDAGFTGLDWVREHEAEAEELLDTGLDPVTLVAAVPEGVTEKDLKGKRILAASEYPRLAEAFLKSRGFDFTLLRTYGATEVFPPDDADLIVDNCATGQTLKANHLEVLAELFGSTTRLLASPKALKDPAKAQALRELADVLRGVLDARDRVLLEMNVEKEKLEALVKALPAMKSPTVQPLHGGGYAVKIAARKHEVRTLLPKIRALGATDILEYALRKVMP
jgi:ATP phosphoribosyltransferase